MCVYSFSSHLLVNVQFSNATLGPIEIHTISFGPMGESLTSDIKIYLCNQYETNVNNVIGTFIGRSSKLHILNFISKKHSHAASSPAQPDSSGAAGHNVLHDTGGVCSELVHETGTRTEHYRKFTSNTEGNISSGMRTEVN